jgi:hypothetical protein
VTLLALDFSRNVTAMIKGHEVWQIVYFYPFDALVLRQRSRNLLNLRRVLENLCVAIHASARGGDTGYSRLVCRRVTVQTLNLVIAGVNLVREVNRLRRLIALLISQAAKDRALPDYGHADQRH